MVNGTFTKLNGKDVYKIENYNQMDNFFMTITSSSDVWNFCWSQGGITAGRIDSNHAVFPYYTADKVHDAAAYTGNYSCVAVKTETGIEYWEPFSSFYMSPVQRKNLEKKRVFNIYKNWNGTEVWFEEINTELKMLFRTGWTSSDKFGLVRTVHIENIGDSKREVSILDGCRNILPACCTSDFQNEKSILLDAYKKTDLDEKSNLAFFTVSSVVSDKAEPNEGLYANVSWFSTEDKILLDTDAPEQFIGMEKLPAQSDFRNDKNLKGQRPSCYICKSLTLNKNEESNWYQVFDTYLDMPKIEQLKVLLQDKKLAAEKLEADIIASDEIMSELIKAADGEQKTADLMSCLHHRQNVMFNIMRGGIFSDEGKVNLKDFMIFVNQRNETFVEKFRAYLKDLKSKDELVCYGDFAELVEKTADPQFTRIFLEYMPVTFSRRHGDPSRPWNQFNIKLKNSNNEPILNYEGNWRDIFQNWEALVYSYPMYIKNMCAKFLNAMTIDGFNPYKINRQGIDWEIPDPNNPWAQIGYWGDHQVIYFEKLLEFYSATQSEELLKSLNEKIYTSSNVPYRIKNYENILENPRESIYFDRELSKNLKALEAKIGSDAKLVSDSEGNPHLVSFAAKVLQIVIAKIANYIPAGGIWLNTQRPEWNDANNALAGYGLSVVTTCYLYRFVAKLIELFEGTDLKTVSVPKQVAECFNHLADLFSTTRPENCSSNDSARKDFVEIAEKLYEAERLSLYENGYEEDEELSCKEIASGLKKINAHFEYTIKANKREDGLYHSYNTLKISDNGMEVCYLQEMLEGQVAVLSSNLLNSKEALDLIKALRASKMYEPRQNSYMLYPNKELPDFWEKNQIKDVSLLESIIERTGTTYVQKDLNGVYHFNPDFRNASVIEDFINSQKGTGVLSKEEKEVLLLVYEQTFNHQSFTGRSGTFYAYEGLGSIYWHMVSKLLLAVQENLVKAYETADSKTTEELRKAYYEVRSGLGYNKTPDLYGAFPAEPYSHTPYYQGAKQPGMTGQVKEEILTRWGELGILVKAGTVTFEPRFLQKEELDSEGNIGFTWCGVPVKYHFEKGAEKTLVLNGKKRTGNTLTQEETKALFLRQNDIKSIELILPL